MSRVKYAASTLLLASMTFLGATVVRAQQSRRPYLYRETWYEFLLKQFNPTGFDYGRWIEERRAAFLDCTANQPAFWYSLFVTGAFLLSAAYITKQLIDDRRKAQTIYRAVADVYNHELYSRQLAKEAIDKYNDHIETCNRAFETSEARDGRPGWGETHLESVRAELQRVSAQLDATTQERNKLQEELRQKALVVSDLSLRLDALTKKVNGSGKGGVLPEPHATINSNDVATVEHINQLQQDLYDERQKNRRLKGP
jgi:hypothetical protein